MSIPIVGQNKGYFISFEGGDGVGKTRHAVLLKQALEETGFQVSLFRSPGTTALGEELRDILKHGDCEVSDIAELLLMCADRAQLVTEQLRPALEAGKICICDRYYYSTIVYQGFGRKLNQQIISALLEYTIGPTVPNLTFVLGVSEEEKAKRLAARKERLAKEVADRYEDEDPEFQSRIKAGFDWLKSNEAKSGGKLVSIDSSGTLEDVHNEIYRCAAFRIGQLKEGALTVNQNKIITP